MTAHPELHNYNQTSSFSHSLPTRDTRLITQTSVCADDGNSNTRINRQKNDKTSVVKITVFVGEIFHKNI